MPERAGGSNAGAGGGWAPVVRPVVRKGRVIDAVPGAGEHTDPAATIEDVATRAGVSVATVSRALRGLPNVAPSTRQRVLDAADRLHYVADPSASRLASGRTLTVGLVVPMLGQWYYTAAYGGIESVLVAAGYDLLPFTTSGPGGLDRFLTTMPFRKRVDGLIVIDTPSRPDALARVVRGTPSTVTIGVRCPEAASLCVANVDGARLAVDHLVDLGHRRIAMIGGLDHDPFEFRVPVDRTRGYRDALTAAGLPQDGTLEVGGNFSLEGGAEAMRHLLRLEVPPTAVFAQSDEMAIGAIQVARDAGMDVPGELSVVGFDDHDVAAYIGLTTVHQDVQRLGERAAELLLQRLRGEASDVVHEQSPTRLLVRATTAPPSRGRRWRR